MKIGTVPDCLQGLTTIEEILISKVHPIVSFYKIGGNQLAYKYSGNVINFRQDIRSQLESFPPSPADLNAIILAKRNTPSGIIEFKVRAQKVEEALIWLRANNIYADIEINEREIQSLPEDGDYSQLLRNLNMEEETQIEGEATGSITESFFPNIAQVQQDAAIFEVIYGGLQWPATDSVAINEFNTEGYICQAFPTLFPHGIGDINYPRLIKMSPNAYFEFLF